jgi:ComEC/Rec2-related protein
MGAVKDGDAAFTGEDMREDLADYSRSGLADLLAVSGTHFTLALGLFLGLARLFTHRKRRQAAAGLLLGLTYALVTGFEAPVQRAFALFALWLIGRLFDLDTDLPTSLAFGAFAILFFQPGALWEPGFQLSRTFSTTADISSRRNSQNSLKISENLYDKAAFKSTLYSLMNQGEYLSGIFSGIFHPVDIRTLLFEPAER